MTLTLKLDLNIVKIYLYSENEVPSFSSSKVIAWQDRHTDTETDRRTHTHFFEYDIYVSYTRFISCSSMREWRKQQIIAKKYEKGC